MGELLGASRRSVDCIDLSLRVVEAGQARVRPLDNVHFHHGDMHKPCLSTTVVRYGSAAARADLQQRTRASPPVKPRAFCVPAERWSPRH
jgi:hypothetical protein